MSRTSKHASEQDSDAPQKTKRELVMEEVRFLLGLIAFLFVFLNFVFGHFKIPSESMQPTLEVGDHLYVNKLAYGVSRHSLMWGLHKLPFLKDGRVFSKTPKRGDVVVFRSPTDGVILIKRLVGLPGDEVETRKGRLFVNGVLVERTHQGQLYYREHQSGIMEVDEYVEQLPDEEDAHSIYERSDFYPFDTRGPYRIPQGKLFFMGDNRDNSTDSRAPGGPGFVPMNNLIGRAEYMVFSLKKCEKEEGVKCPGRRSFLKL